MNVDEDVFGRLGRGKVAGGGLFLGELVFELFVLFLFLLDFLLNLADALVYLL